MSEIGEFLKVPVEHLDAFIGHEIYIIHDLSAPEESGAWELLQDVGKEFVRQAGSVGQPDTMILDDVKVGVDQSRWGSYSDSRWIAHFAPGKFARVRPSQRESNAMTPSEGAAMSKELQVATRADMIPGAKLMHITGQRVEVVGEKRLGRVTGWATKGTDGNPSLSILPGDLNQYFVIPADDASTS